MKDTFYFPHDYNSRTDEKIKLLIRKHGIEGYGIFWAIIEDLYNNANALRTDYDGIAYDLRSDYETVKSVICDFDLFTINGDFFGSKSIERRLQERNQKSEKARKSATNRWEKYDRNANALPTHYDCNAIKERKGKERKEIKETDQKEPPNFSLKIQPPTLDEVIEFFKSHGFARSGAEKFWNHYQLAEPKPWTDKGGSNIIPFWRQNANSKWFAESEKIQVHKNSSNILR